MKLLLQSAMIFFGTLLAAGLLALGEPSSGRGGAQARARAEAAAAAEAAAQPVVWQERTASARAER